MGHGDCQDIRAGWGGAERIPGGAADFLAEYSIPCEQRRLITSDGVELDALRLGREPGRAVVICHGFGGNKNVAGLVACAESLAADFRVYVFDFRGHGLSGGTCTLTAREVDDLEAVLSLARDEGNRRVGILGFSMGGVVALRYAAERGGLDCLVVVSVPCRWEEARAPGARFLRFLFLTAPGRGLLKSRFGVRMDPDADLPPSPADLVGRLGTQPLTIVAGADDFIFEAEQARQLHRLAGKAARLRVFDGFGHAELGCGPLFFQYVKEVLREDLGR